MIYWENFDVKYPD